MSGPLKSIPDCGVWGGCWNLGWTVARVNNSTIGRPDMRGRTLGLRLLRRTP